MFLENFKKNVEQKWYSVDGEDIMENNDYYEIPISLFWFWFWLIIMGIFTLISMGALFFTLVVPIIIYFQLKQIKYRYNNKELKIKKGLIFKSQRNIAINKIEENEVNPNY